MKKDSNQEIKSRCNCFFRQASHQTIEKILIYEKELGLEDLSSEQMILKLNHEKLLLEEQKKVFLFKVYLNYAHTAVGLEYVFSDYYLFYHDHEEVKMQQALYLFEKGRLLDRLIMEAQCQGPLFTIEKYDKSEMNVVFYLLNQQPWGVSDEDYAKMLFKQNQYQSKCIFSLCLKIRKLFIEQLKDENNLLREAGKELKNLRKLLDPTNHLSNRQFGAELKKLTGLNHFKLPADENEFYRSFLKYVDHPHPTDRLCPNVFKQCLQDIKEDRLPLCAVSGPALLRYEAWLNDLVFDLVSLHDHPELCYDQLFDQLVKESKELENQQIDQFRADYSSQSLSAIDYESIIHRELERIKKQVDQLIVSDYYHYLPDRKMTKYCFINNCLDSKRIDFQSEELKNAILIDGLLRFFNQELVFIGKEIKATLGDIEKLNSTVSLVIAQMVPTQQIVCEIKAAFEKAMHDYHNRKPILYILEDLDSEFNKIFEEAVDNLFELFSTQPYDERMTYALKISNEIKIMEYKARTRGLVIHKFYRRLNEIVEIWLDYLMKNNYIDSLDFDARVNVDLPLLVDTPLNVDLPGKKTKTTEEELVSFEFIGKVEYLRMILNMVDQRYGMLTTRTSIEMMVTILTCKDLRIVEGEVHFACLNTMVKCVYLNMKPYFTNLTCANMERSGLFFCKSGKPFSAHTIGNTLLKNQSMKRTIESFFRKFS